MNDRKRQKYSRAERATTQVVVVVIFRGIDRRYFRTFRGLLIRSRVRESSESVRRIGTVVEVASPRVYPGYVYASSSSGIEPDLSGGTLDSAVHRLLYSRATPYSTWQDDFSYDKYSDRAAVHSRRSAADANNIRRRRDGVVNMRERGQ